MFKKKKKEKQISTPLEEVEELNNELELETKEEALKSDGSVVIGSLDESNNFISTNEPLPDQIDIEARKKAKLLEQDAKKKKGKIEESKEAKMVQTIVALVVLSLFGAVYGVYYYYKNVSNNKDFSVKKVHVEYGQPASLAIATYVNVESPDEKLYTLDLSEFVPDEMGEYHFKVTYSGIVKTGIIEVSDTLAPEVETKDVTLNPGDTYTPNMFIDSCVDLNDCYVTFEDGDTIKTTLEQGESSVYLNVKDKLGNQTTKQAKLTTISTDIIYNCSYTYNINYDLGYRQTTTYEVIYDKDYNYLTSNKLTTYAYIDNNEYLKYKDNHQASSYLYDDSLSTVTHKEKNEAGFNGNRDYESINRYLVNQNYTCTLKQ